MSERTGLTAEFQRQIRLSLKEEVNRGLTYEGCIGFHGTSIQTLAYVLENGVVPGTTEVSEIQGISRPNLGDLYFWHLGISPPTLSHWGPYDPFGKSIAYAKQIARFHYLMERFKLDFSRTSDNHLALELSNFGSEYDECVQELVSRKKGRISTIEREVDKALEYNGIIIGINNSVTERFPIVDCNSHDDGWKIVTGKGLPYNYVFGVFPLGEPERKFLSRI